MTKNRRRKQDTRAQAAGGKYTTGLLVDPRPRLMLPLHAPYTGPRRCPKCSGTGVLDGVTVDFAVDDATAVMVCQVFCPLCFGCGRGEHTECRADEHAEPEEVGMDPDGWYDEDTADDAGVDETDRCFSCGNRRWWSMQAFDQAAVYRVRVPCGCSSSLLIPAGAA